MQDDALIRNPEGPFATTFATSKQAFVDLPTYRRNLLGVRIAGAILVAISVAAVSATSTAQTVPAPKATPKARSGAQSSPDGRKGPITTGSSRTPADPIIPYPRPNVGFFQTFNDNQKAQAAKVSAYLSSLQTLVGKFVQRAPDGSRTTGDFYIQKPGKVRFEYDDPSPIDIVADGSSLVVRDRRLATQDVYPLSQTPLRYLLSDRIDLMRDTNVIDVTSNNLYVSITIEEKQALVGTSRLMLMFNAKDGQLKQWVVTDPQGYDTVIAVSDLDSTKKLDPSMFKIDYTNYNTPTGQ